jgi:membrane protein
MKGDEFMGIVKTLKGNKLVQFIKDLLSKLKQDDAIPYAYQLSYRLMLAIFPFLIFLLTLVGFINLDPDKIIEQIEVLMPGEAFGLFEGIVNEVAGKQNGTLLSISIITAIWSAAGGFKAFMKAMNKVHGLKEERSFFLVNLNAIIYVVLLAIGIVGSLLLVVFFQPIISTVKSYLPTVEIGSSETILSMILPLAFILLLFLAFYIFVPAKKIKIRYALPGAITASVAFMVVSMGFQFYVATFANYSRFYGAMGAVVILIFWLLLISIIMVVGGSINSLLIHNKGIRYPYWGSKEVEENKVRVEAVDKLEERYRNSKGASKERL